MASADFSAAAQDDVIEIWRFIATKSGSGEVAHKFVEKIKSAASDQSSQPLSGYPRFDLVPNLRAINVGRYVLFYLPTSTGITILRVIQGSRDMKRAFHSR